MFTKIVTAAILLLSFSTKAQEFDSKGLAILSYQGRFSQGETVQEPRTQEDRLNVFIPIHKSESQTWLMPLSYSHIGLGQKVILDSGVAVPQNLSRTELALHYTRRYPDKSSLSFRGAIGYAGDKGIGETNDNTFTISSSYNFLSDSQQRWAVSLFFTNNGLLANYIPIPGFLYFVKSDTFNGQFGFPFNRFEWTPDQLWTLTFTALLININFETAYLITDKTSLLANLSSAQQTFILKERVEDRDRLSFSEDKIGLGVRFRVFDTVITDLTVGRAFNRSVYIGKGFLNKDRGEARLDKDNYIAWGLRYVF